MSDYEIALEHKIVRRDLIISRLKNEIDELKELLDFASNEREAAEKEHDSWKTQWVACCENLDAVAKERDLLKAENEAMKQSIRDVKQATGWSTIPELLESRLKDLFKLVEKQ